MERPSGHRIFDGKGGETRYQNVLASCRDADVLLFGELHDNPLVHRLQLEMTKDLFDIRKGDLVLGAEMFEADDQLVLDEYLAGLIKPEHLVQESKVWDNYETDYRPLVDFSKAHGLRFIATNIPRRYANLVARQGIRALELLSDDAKRSIAPLPIVVDLSAPGYGEMLEMGAAHGMQMDAENFVAAQAVKDATMAHFIAKNRHEGKLFIHYHGDYHSKNYGGIYWYLKRSDPGLVIRTISSVSSETMDFDDDDRGRADYILVLPRDTTEGS
jgi:uncharacterized iron-regulated protein